MKMHPMKYHDKPASAGLKKLAAANPDKLKYIGPEKYGPEKYHGPNMYDKPMFIGMSESYVVKNSFKDSEKEESNGSCGSDKKDSASSNLSAARKRKKDARKKLKADRLNRSADRMEGRRR